MLKLNVGLSRKVGEPNYSSRGASVNLELELDSSLVADPEKLKERIRQLFVLARTSVAEELNGGYGKSADSGSTHAKTSSSSSTRQPSGPTNGTGANAIGEQNRPQAPRAATAAQVKAIQAIARKRQIDIVQFLRERFQVSSADGLSLKDASHAIDELRDAAGPGA